MLIRVIRNAVPFIALIIFLDLVYAQKTEVPTVAQEMKKTVEAKTMQGEVSGISNKFIAVLYGQDAKTSYEMAFNLNKDVKIEHKKALKDIKTGDSVAVDYEETVEAREGQKPKVVQRSVKKIKFLSSPQVKPETNALVSEDVSEKKPIEESGQ